LESDAAISGRGFGRLDFGLNREKEKAAATTAERKNCNFFVGTEFRKYEYCLHTCDVFADLRFWIDKIGDTLIA
jgi:hypothetical protein